MKIKELTQAIEAYAPLHLQESYDNSGMQVGDVEREVTGVLLCTDVREDTLDEAIATGTNLIVSHHPLIFHGLKKVVGRSYIERVVAKALKHDVAIYSAHTNMDNARGGVNFKIAEKLGLTDVEVLAPQTGTLRKVVTFVPEAQAQAVAEAMHAAGAGRLGDYDCCSYRMRGEGFFRPLDGANPAIGRVGEAHMEPETRVEVLTHERCCSAVVKAMLEAHPYEEPAFDVIRLENADRYSGSGVIGTVNATTVGAFLTQAKNALEVAMLRYSGDLNRELTRVALCGGSGSFLLGQAMAQGAQLFVSADFKYHEFMGNEDRIVIADLGHYETEHFTKEIFYDIISEKNPTFAVRFASTEKNQVAYL